MIRETESSVAKAKIPILYFGKRFASKNAKKKAVKAWDEGNEQ